MFGKHNNSFISHDLCNDFLLQYVTELHNLLALSVEDQDFFLTIENPSFLLGPFMNCAPGITRTPCLIHCTQCP